MPELFDDSPGTIFASAAGLIVYFGRVPSIPVAWAISEKEGKVQLDQNVSFSRGRGKLFVLKQCWPFSRFNLSAHLRMFWEDLGVILLRSITHSSGRLKKLMKGWSEDLHYLSKATCLLQRRWFDQPYHRVSWINPVSDYVIFAVQKKSKKLSMVKIRIWRYKLGLVLLPLSKN
jgi:hypothetical protein